MRTMPTITLKRTPSDHIIATDENGLARVLETREELDEYIDLFCMDMALRDQSRDAFAVMCGNPAEQVDELINRLHP